MSNATSARQYLRDQLPLVAESIGVWAEVAAICENNHNRLRAAHLDDWQETHREADDAALLQWMMLCRSMVATLRDTRRLQASLLKALKRDDQQAVADIVPRLTAAGERRKYFEGMIREESTTAKGGGDE